MSRMESYFAGPRRPGLPDSSQWTATFSFSRSSLCYPSAFCYFARRQIGLAMWRRSYPPFSPPSPGSLQASSQSLVANYRMKLTRLRPSVF